MKNITLLLFFLATVLTSCNKQANVENTSSLAQELADQFPNKKLTYWDKKKSYELHLYGDLAYIRCNNENASKYLYPIDTKRFISI